jgi:hypothetical protein
MVMINWRVNGDLKTVLIFVSDFDIRLPALPTTGRRRQGFEFFYC